jgi:tripeptidyl-peptidase II
MSKFILIILMLVSSQLFAEEGWSFLNTGRIGAARFLKERPSANGKSTIIFIMDSGVDPGVAGLKTLPDGGPKVIDVHDFSGEGDVYLEEAEKGEENDEYFLTTGYGYKMFGYKLLKEAPLDSLYLIGVLEERNFLNTKVRDINANGKTDDRFGVILFKNKNDKWVAYVDLDGDVNISDEKPQTDYSENRQVLQFRGYDKKYDYLPLNMALKIFPDEEKVNFHFDGNGHGTHVAGIAAGYKINGIETLNGIAPGAKIISLKIGNTRFKGAGTVTGSMRSAYEFVAGYVQNNDTPVVINMSYGIASVAEGFSDMEGFLNDYLAENPNIVVCLSAGNEGPGISSVGLPAAASSAISVGALNTVENAKDLYGGNIKSDKIFIFSSRGGEVSKPEIIAPGAASSTIPPFSSSEVKWGTSMASPQVSGAVSVLLSALGQEFPNKKADAFMVKRALLNSAVPMPGYSVLDQGNGVVNIPDAYTLLKNYVQKDEIITGFEVSTISPAFDDGYGPAVYWRHGLAHPTKEKKQTIYINAQFKEGLTVEQKRGFYRAFKLSSGADWLKVKQGSVYIKGEAPAEIEVYCDEEKIKKPGLYSTYLYGFEKSSFLSSKSDENKQFQILCTIIIPETIDENVALSIHKSKIKLSPGDIHRVFVLVPNSSLAMSLRVIQNGQEYGNLRIYAFNQQGSEGAKTLYWDTQKSGEALRRITTDELTPGTWEFVFYAPFTNIKTSLFDFEISFSGLEILQKEISRFSIRNGENPTGRFSAINHFGQTLNSKVGGRIRGVQKSFSLREEFGSYQHSFNVGDLYRSVEFEFDMSKSIYNKLTDFTINIKNTNGKILKTVGIDGTHTKVTFIPPSSDSYMLELIPAFTYEGQSWNIQIKESFFYFRQPAVTTRRVDFYPFIKKKVYFSLDSPINVAPDGFHLFGEIWIDSLGKNKIRTVVPIKIDSSL